jgi:hypothetical protein
MIIIYKLWGGKMKERNPKEDFKRETLNFIYDATRQDIAVLQKFYNIARGKFEAQLYDGLDELEAGFFPRGFFGRKEYAVGMEGKGINYLERADRLLGEVRRKVENSIKEALDFQKQIEEMLEGKKEETH